MVGVVSGSLYRWTHSLSRLAWSRVGGRLAPFYIHQINRVNSRNGSAIARVLLLLLLIIIMHQTCQRQTVKTLLCLSIYHRQHDIV